MELVGRVAVVTGAGAGLGRAHALRLAQHGAKVLVNDLEQSAAQRVAEEIRGAGGEAIAVGCSVTDETAVDAMMACAIREFGAVDILINNAGILRDRTFAKLSIEDFRLIVDVHLMGAVICTKAVWEHMRARAYGRIVMTTSSSGLYGNFGQANYGAAKMALVGLMQTLGLEGAKHNIRVNALAPSASTRMTQDLLTEAQLSRLGPELVSPGVVALCREDAPNRTILCAGAGAFEQAHITLTRGIVTEDPDAAASEIARQWASIADPEGQRIPVQGWEQLGFELEKQGFLPQVEPAL